jgi:NitT/TauT family transport system permease protein
MGQQGEFSDRTQESAPAQGETRSRFRFFRNQERRIISLTAVVIFFALWELIGRSGMVRPILISSPSRIWTAGIWLFENGLWSDIAVSLMEFALGYGAAVLIAVPLGLAMGWSPRLNAVIDPFAQALNATPRVALVPVIMIWLGIGLASKVAVVFLGAFFPILLGAVAGVQNTDDLLLRCARSFGATNHQIFRTVIVPSSVPWLVTGMRIGVGRAVVGVVVAELIAATAGIGHMMAVAGATFQTDKVFVGILMLAGFGYLTSSLLRRIENRYQDWKPAQ